VHHIWRNIIAGFGFPVQVPDNLGGRSHVLGFTLDPEMMATTANFHVHAPLNVLEVLIKLPTKRRQAALVYGV
jgi:hypothetical protein